MRPTRLVIAAVIALLGILWLGQGLGIIAGSAMSGSPFWAAVGAALLVLAVVVVLLERRRTA